MPMWRWGARPQSYVLYQIVFLHISIDFTGLADVIIL
jgi:hypothetical protein